MIVFNTCDKVYLLSTLRVLWGFKVFYWCGDGFIGEVIKTSL